MKSDIRSYLKSLVAIAPQAVSTDKVTTGAIIDTAEFEGGGVFTFSHSRTCGDATPEIKESDSATFADSGTVLADDQLIGDVLTGQEADSKLDGSQLISSLGVVGNTKRYLRATLTSANSYNGVLQAVFHGKQNVKPISN